MVECFFMNWLWIRVQLQSLKMCTAIWTIIVPFECMKVITIVDRKEMIKKQKLCYDCCKFGHQATKYSSKDCRKCGAKHHTSICDKINSTKFEEDKLKSLGTFETQRLIYLTVICDVNGVKARALIDAGAGNSYISTYL